MMALSGDTCEPPTPTPEPCYDGLAQLITQNDFASIGLTQEAQDMLAIASSTGLILHQGPTLNARTLTTIPWGSGIPVTARLVFGSGSFTQVWYRTSYNLATGWVAARIEDKFYIEGVSEDTDPCSMIDTPSELTFTYDRPQAAAFASQHAYQNNISPIPASANRVTRRLSANPYNLPFANFVYSDLAGGAESTGSAVFVSESIWAGGLPMTIGDPNSCTSVLFSEAGWRYCSVTSVGGNSSTAWEVHEGLGEYYTDAQIPIPGFGGSNNVLVYGIYANKGTQITFVQNPTYPITNTDRIVQEDIDDYLGDVSLGGDDTAFNPTAISGFSETHLSQIKAGDYIWINSYDPGPPQLGSPHGLIVVGWASPTTCGNALTTILAPSNFSAEYVANTIPYVADTTSLQSPVPRPFYCTLFIEPSRENFLFHSWRFYILADQITLPTEQVYIQPDWQWEATDGQ